MEKTSEKPANPGKRGGKRPGAGRRQTHASGPAVKRSVSLAPATDARIAAEAAERGESYSARLEHLLQSAWRN
jgi:hypothetical protein